MTMFIYAFCKSCEIGCEREIVFVYDFDFVNNFRFATITKHVNNHTNCLIVLEKL